MNEFKTAPLVSIVIVNWNGLEDTKICLESVREQTYKNIEIIIVDNGSVDKSLAYLEKQSDIILVKNRKNLGFTGGHIAGYKKAQGAFIMLLNNDAVMQKDYVERAVTTMTKDEKVAVLGGRAYFWNDENPIFDTSNNFYAYQQINPITAEGIFTQQDAGEQQEVNNVSGSCVLIRNSVIEQIGYLYDPFFAYYEESDLFARIKRAGFKVIYDPELAIWHANGKSAERKGSSFSFYMMMRNRFGFAVRNFDSWALKRFLKFYCKMGIVSTVKSFGTHDTVTMDRAYSKAFFYNIFFGLKYFIERSTLAKQLGDQNYTEMIIAEQSGLSIIVTCDSTKDVDICYKFSQKLRPSDEIIMMLTDKKDVLKAAKQYSDIGSPRIRYSIDKKLFNTSSLNIGALSAKNEWLILCPERTLLSNESLDIFVRSMYGLRQNHKQALCICTNKASIDASENFLNIPCEKQLLINKHLFINAGGLAKETTDYDAIRLLLTYSAIDGNLLVKPLSTIKNPLPAYGGMLTEHEIMKTLRIVQNEANTMHRRSTYFDRLTARYYRLQQLRNTFIWFFSNKISSRLKLARTRNLFIYAITLHRKKFATELKHVRNEVFRLKTSFIDMDSRKEQEKERLAYLMQHPEDTPIFIITRDRLQPLEKLCAWFKKQGLNRIVLIDNDSALPPLMDYLRKTDYQVLETLQNIGHTVPWTAGIIRILTPNDFYIVTDPDVIPVMDSKKVLEHLYHIHEEYPNHLKIGLGLKIDDLPDTYTLKKSVIEWESQFWKHPMKDDVFEAGVDTTFALYKPYTQKYFIHPSLRTGEPFTARHLPWYAKSDEPNEEEIFYRIRADQNVNTWDKGKLPERYQKELDKQRR